MLKRLVAVFLILLVAIASPVTVLAQSATPSVDDVIDDHLEWVIGLFDGGAAGLTEAEVQGHFDPAFLDVVPAKEFIATIQQLERDLGPIGLVEEQANIPSGEFVGVFEAASGERLTISFAVDSDSGLIAGFFITPAAANSPGATPAAATPSASPVPADIVVTDAEAQMALYQEQASAVREIGEPVVEAVLAGDDAALAPYLSQEMTAALQGVPVSDIVGSYTTNQVQMSFVEAGAHFFGQWRDETIEGVMIQGGPVPFTLTATDPQSGDLPTGRWDGELVGAGLEISVAFGTDDAGDLTATLDIPAQNVADQPLHNVAFAAEQPIGDLVQEQVFAAGGLNNGYTAEFAWGEALLRISAAVDVEAGEVAGLQILPAMPLPDDPAAGYHSDVTYRLPFEGTWWVFWGGETELQNYHAATSSQRHAYDLVIWKDGATYSGDGAQNEDYWAWGQQVVAPADGTVVGVVDNQPDLPPNAPVQERGASGNPGGNHVVLQTAEGEYVFIAHLQEGSVQVAVGDEVRAGDPLGLTGNSGNSSEPHVHIHVQDSPELLDYAATGLPLVFDTAVVDGEPVEDAVPVQGSFVAHP